MLSSTSFISPLCYVLILTLSTIDASADRISLSSTRCPSSCYEELEASEHWSAYRDLHQLSECEGSILLDFNLHNPFDDSNSHPNIRACSAYFPNKIFTRNDDYSTPADSNPIVPPSSLSNACGTPPFRNTTSEFSIIKSSTAVSTDDATDIQAIRISQYRMTHKNATSCNGTTSFVMTGSRVVGIFVGASVPIQPLSDQVLESLVADITNNGASDSIYVESCSISPNGSSQNMGIVIGNFSILPRVQSAVSVWSSGGCMTTDWTINSSAIAWQSFELPLWSQPAVTPNITYPQSDHAHSSKHRRFLSPRGDCTTVQVKSGDSCAQLATECGISAADFTTLNPGPSLCSTLTPGQHLCCSAGTLPNIAPKPQSDGTCATYTVATNDTCSGLATANSIAVDDINNWNNNTWQFMGCTDLQIGQLICLSAGEPPMPASIKGAICGPQVPGTQKPDNISIAGALASLNPCPLNVCCDIWGQCGNTEEFCTISKSKSGAPGTAASGENGCISNCGIDIVQSTPPAKVFTVGYFEGYNQQRPCLTMDASEIDVTAYTHLHFGFAALSNSFDVVINDNLTAVWSSFLTLRGPDLILSLGGWAFSTDPSTYSIFRDAVTEANRQTFANKVAAFVKQSGIAGLDFDWEYPGESDIPGIPAGNLDDGANYLAFLKVLRETLPSNTTISIAAPASYWYLRGFPIAAISEVVDYIVFMTYDLHGQWDYGNNFSSPGCPGGNCLRSQVNSTETHTSLSMITKAGVPSNKIVVGVTSYGRSFEMTDSGCTGPMCTYTGPHSGATPGRCTQTAGYLANAEIYEILSENDGAKTFYDNDSESDIMIYNGTQWVAFMSNNTRIARSNTYIGWNFLGTVDWAIDLANFSKEEAEIDDAPYVELPDCFDGDHYRNVDDVLANSSVPEFCMNVYLMQALSATMSESLDNYTSIMNSGYAGKYKAYAREVRNQGYWAWNDNIWGNQNRWWNCFQEKSGKNKSVSCGSTPGGDAYYYVVKDETTFCSNLSSQYNLDCDWITMASESYTDPGDGGDACKRFGMCPADGTMHYPSFDNNFPVLDPSALITKSLSNYTGFSEWLSDSANMATVLNFAASDADAVDASSTVVFSLQSAMQAMQQVADVGAQAKKEQKKDMILAFITAFLLVVPGIGEAADGVAALAQVARIARLVDVAGNAALGVYGAVEDPKSAPMAVAGILLGGFALRDDSAWAKAATKTRGMSQDLIKSMGDGVATGMGKIQKACKRCNQ